LTASRTFRERRTNPTLPDVREMSGRALLVV
jgi:hypothetical protein